MNIDNDFVLALAQYVLIGVGILVAGFTIVGGISFWKTQKGSAKTFSLLLQRGSALRIITVIVVAMIVALLALVGKIEGVVVVSILSGIVGYVLGGLEKVNSKEDED